MDFLSGLFGAADEDDEPTRIAKANDFVSRVESGDKTEGYSPEEAFQNYASVTQRLSSEEFEGATADALRQLSPAQRREFAQVMQEQGGVDVETSTEDPDLLASLIRQLRFGATGNAAGLPAGLLGGGGHHDLTGALSGLLGGGNTGSPETAELNQAGIAGLLNNPIVKTVLGLIAANGMKRVMGGGQDTNEAASDEDSGGGFLDALFGRDDDNTASERDRQERTPSDRRGGFLDSLLGTDDDKEKTDDIDISKIDPNEPKRRM